ncbi:LysM peptidoglycan-binding domain-containing protein [Cyanobium sp. Morenito 9A2]|uniref:lytic transglycosylase n=1 Tax=Cyanobium sp. Morenito 9A2 TaxID=2823718 RepID=UPI0020CCACF2|nr:LysM peptidoglycan-binding domain-containing protein [Cyanobium sp. Morenito 9A2]MCP9851012.1 LysM peptidoglycan-binding domain-containing protein [Cyanobium sp. Morenito 9A2]
MRAFAVVFALLLVAPGTWLPGPWVLGSGSQAQAQAQGLPSGGSITVREGDSLEAIALRHGVSLEGLIQINQLKDANQLVVGQRLLLPPPGAGVLIRSGDTLDAIASRRGTTVEALLRLNPGVQAEALQVGGWLKLPTGGSALDGALIPRPESPAPPRAQGPTVPAPPAGTGEQTAAAALLLSPAERRDRADLNLREQSGRARWRRFGQTDVDWAGWRLHPGGVRITLVKASVADLGVRRSGATAVAVQCESLRQTWRIDGDWEAWAPPEPRSVGQRIVIDLCSNTLDAPALPVAP